MGTGTGDFREMNLDPNFTVPEEIIQAVVKVERWMQVHQGTMDGRWELMGICSRNHAVDLQQWEEGGVTEELLRRNDGCIKIGKGCAIVRDPDYNVFDSFKEDGK